MVNRIFNFFTKDLTLYTYILGCGLYFFKIYSSKYQPNINPYILNIMPLILVVIFSFVVANLLKMRFNLTNNKVANVIISIASITILLGNIADLFL